MFTLEQGEQHSRKTNRAEVGCNSAVAEPGFLDWICEVIKKITQQYKLLVSECHYLLHQCKLLVKLD
jgi:hypothetical protein